jgi:hypothetical protein
MAAAVIKEVRPMKRFFSWGVVMEMTVRNSRRAGGQPKANVR